jgi:hypothetical protein
MTLNAMSIEAADNRGAVRSDRRFEKTYHSSSCRVDTRGVSFSSPLSSMMWSMPFSSL